MEQGDKKTTYNLEERTAVFGENIISLCKSIKINIFTEPIVKQILRSATSVGANYLEANGASSRKDFCNKIYICKKETQETRHWLRMLTQALDSIPPEIESLEDESRRLAMIFHKIASTTRQ
jgi:four helix bundle protein